MEQSVRANLLREMGEMSLYRVAEQQTDRTTISEGTGSTEEETSAYDA